MCKDVRTAKSLVLSGNCKYFVYHWGWEEVTVDMANKAGGSCQGCEISILNGVKAFKVRIIE